MFLDSGHNYCQHCGNPLVRFVSPETAARLTDMSVEYWRKLIKERKIKVVKFGRSVRIPFSEILANAHEYAPIRTKEDVLNELIGS